MIRTRMTLAMALAVGGVTLSGCAGTARFLGLSHEPLKDVAIRTAQPSEPARFLEAGRNALLEGRNEEAIVQLRLAMAAGGDIAEASNGIGVALARMGQPEEALRYFERAMAMAPDVAKFRNNAQRANAQVRLAQAAAMPHPEVASVELAAASRPAPAPAGGSVTTTGRLIAPRSGISLAGVSGRPMQRVSRGEVRVSGGAPGSASGKPGFVPLVRIEFARSESPRASASDERKADADKSEARTDAGAERQPDRSRTITVAGFTPLVRMKID